MQTIIVCALYKFIRLDNFQELREPLLQQMLENEVRGTILLAHEGINGTISGTRHGIDKVLAWLKNDPRLKPLDVKESFHDSTPFHRSKVKLKKEIVTMGVEDIDPQEHAGTYVEPQDWNDLISRDDVLVIDTRNQYEVEIGQFTNAINPETNSFRDFPAYADSKLGEHKDKKIAMYCTGGIRCEKSTAYLKQQGFNDVYHLKGGILKYLEEVSAAESLWEGECFVFDDRVAVNQDLEKGSYDQCHACRFPITPEQMQHPHYQPGVSCPRCHGKHSEEQLKRFSERQKQMELAKSRGEVHLGTEAKLLGKERKKRKHNARQTAKD